MEHGHAATGGTYEFRLFLNNGYTRAATSAPVIVDPSLTPPPVVTSLSPGRTFAGGGKFTLTVTGSSFVPSSIVLWNGESRPTTFVSTIQIRAAIGAADILSIGGAQVAVRTPLAWRRDFGFVACHDRCAARALAERDQRPGRHRPYRDAYRRSRRIDRLAFDRSGWRTGQRGLGAMDLCRRRRHEPYVDRCSAFNDRSGPEFRLYLNGYARAATSAPITVTTAVPAALTVNTASASGGSPVTVTLANGRGGATDWLALAAVGAPNGTYLKWIYVGAGVTTRTWTVTMPSAGGVYEFRLFLNGGYVRAATSPPVTVAASTPALTVNTTSVVGGKRDGDTDRRRRRVNRLADAGPGRRCEYQLPAMDLRRFGRDDAHVDRRDAGGDRHL